ncbi:MAG TPA: class I SAM-dependent methyltransferase [Candidatus Binataceae bacterium]|nr:class I SAM-dependent methyltransferase [Candidatus Binataceae bacterium]
MREAAALPGRAWKWLDDRFGRGSYRVLRDWLDPTREYTQLIYGRLLGELADGRTSWLDAGCGRRILELSSSAREREALTGARFAVGCDLELSALRRHRTLSNRICCDLAALPFRDRSFQLVSLNNVAEHFADPAPIFREIARVLDLDGRLAIHTPNAAGYFVRVARLARRVLPRRLVLGLISYMEGRGDDDVFPTYYRANTRAALVRLAAEAGMAVERLSLVRGRPLFYFAVPLAALELVATRVMVRGGLEGFGCKAIIGVLARAGGAGRPAGDAAGDAG